MAVSAHSGTLVSSRLLLLGCVRKHLTPTPVSSFPLRDLCFQGNSISTYKPGVGEAWEPAVSGPPKPAVQSCALPRPGRAMAQVPPVV